MLDKSNKRRLAFDLILILALLAVTLSALFIYLAVRDEGSYVQVAVDNEIILERPLDIDAEYSLNGGSNVLRIKDGKASVIYADCPDKVCVNTGEICYELDSIVCLPNRLHVRIINK